MISADQYEKGLSPNPANSGNSATLSGKTGVNAVNTIGSVGKTPDTPAHTPLPWSITRTPSGRPYSIHSLSPEDLNSQHGRVGAQILRWGSFMLPSSAEAEANAAFIVRACNSHYSLVETIKACREQFDFYAAEHRKAEKHEKAATNERFAFLCSEALSQAGGE